MKEKNVLETIGNTPLIKIGRIYAKLETTNPSGSIKDRMAKYMIERAEERGELRANSYIIEATSGNTGVSFAMISAIKKYKFIAVMPESISKEKRKLIKIFGAKIVLTPEKKGLEGAIRKTEELSRKYRKVWLPKQFENPDNIEAHRKGLGQEILKEVPRIDAFVAGFGTGGTLTGVAKALKSKFSKVKIIGVEAAESLHQIEGISDGIIPKNLDFNLIDEVIEIKSKDAILMARQLIKKYSLLIGISSGANVLAALKLSKKYKNVVTVLPDRAERYLDLW
ncbi:MAG TPA: cysteine synthase family protein [Candidatus Humimicrobiaceae bacterium]|nr:cysteine synthase family protein [Candidatus Humimicrobiaceae bacterium]